MAFVLKAVINIYPKALPNLPRTISLTSTFHNTLINSIIITYYNYRENSYFILFYLKLKDLDNIKEIEKEDLYNKLGKDKP